MMRLFRMLQFGVVMIHRAAAMSIAARKMPPAERVRFIAEQQRRGSRDLCRIVGISVDVVGAIGDSPRGVVVEAVHGRGNTAVADIADIQPARPHLIVANHIGTLDPWIMASVFRAAFVAKSEMASWPVMGWVCQAVGIVFAHRGNVMRTAVMIDEIRDRMNAGVGVLIFPEGTTSDGTDLMPFKTGGFEAVSHVEDSVVLPVYFHVRSIRGERVTTESRRRITWTAPQGLFCNLWVMFGLRRLRIVVRVGAPVPAFGRSRKELAQECWEMMNGMRLDEERALDG